MYNFSIPSALKAWIDPLARIHCGFGYDGQQFEGLLGGRSAHIAVAYGAAGYLNGGPFVGADFVTPYRRFVLNFLGISEVHVHAAEGTTGDAAGIEAQLEAVAKNLALSPAREGVRLAAAKPGGTRQRSPNRRTDGLLGTLPGRRPSCVARGTPHAGPLRNPAACQCRKS